MKTTLGTESLSDAQLVEWSLTGDREAFGRIVERYQSLVCSITYSATGSLGLSEDIAQETFLTAWRKLDALSDTAKLRAWLCGIARNLVNNSLRRGQREPVHAAEPLDTIHEPASPEPSPLAEAVSREEEGILWRALERIPDTYREPLILFYRENQSVESVAEELELSEDAVKQRLSRGRKLLTDEVAAFVEGTLQRTTPGKVFTLGVLAALPLTATSVKAAVVGTTVATAKGSGAAKGAGMLGTIGSAASALGAATGCIFAIWGRIQTARSVRERKFLAKASWGFLIWVVALQVTIHVVASFSGGVIINNLRDAISWALVWIGLFGAWIAYSIWMGRRQRRIQIEDGTFPVVRGGGFLDVGAAGKGFRAIVYGGLAAMIFGPGGLLLMVVGVVGDKLAFGVLSVLAVVAWLACAGAIMRRPERIKRIFVAVWWGLALVTLATLNLRWDAWVHHAHARAVLWPTSPNQFHPAPMSLNFLILVFYGSIGLAWWLERYFVATRKLRRDATVALLVYWLVLVLGIVLVLSKAV